MESTFIAVHPRLDPPAALRGLCGSKTVAGCWLLVKTLCVFFVLFVSFVVKGIEVDSRSELARDVVGGRE